MGGWRLCRGGSAEGSESKRRVSPDSDRRLASWLHLASRLSGSLCLKDHFLDVSDSFMGGHMCTRVRVCVHVCVRVCVF